MKLLVVDDNASVRRLIARVVAPITAEIAECADGAHALLAYEQHRPDVVLMDIGMRQLDGISAAAAIIGAHPHARIVMVTDYDEPDLRDAARAAGACAYVVKENLLELRRILGAMQS